MSEEVLSLDAPVLQMGRPIDGPCQAPVRKVFVSTFRLVFKRTEDQAITWIEVKSLDGLKTVVGRLGRGEIVPVNASATLNLQLWALLAEHVGFLSFAKPKGDLNAGIQPLGAEQADLVGDMTELFGGFEPALQALSAMRNEAVQSAKDAAVESAMKEDGVNLTPDAEKKLATLVYGMAGDDEDSVVVTMSAANAETLLKETEPEPIEHPEIHFDKISDQEAFDIGKKIEKAADGDLEDEEEVGP